MGTISVTWPSDGDTIDASDVSTPGNTIVNAINGNLDSNNLANGAVTAAKIVGIDKSILTTDSNPYKFSVYHNTTQTITTAGATVAFNTELFDTNNNFAANTYTAPVDGFYCFIGATSWAATASQTRAVLDLYKNGAILHRLGDVSTGAGAFGVNGAVFIQLAATNTVTLFFSPIGATTTLRGPGGADNTYFSGFLISRT